CARSRYYSGTYYYSYW
nr:immunoglobulin heavy chain junction region [Macaca mulatta]MOW99769.1 immunoglobulin heavy chain junction region [Macaca mulatta]MOX02514.1 immunoglobulin heavy chain junction region [Macaca mulatta]MOX06106.1 immunoglobulin heavy chain junction region [Macaca mulatta]